MCVFSLAHWTVLDMRIDELAERIVKKHKLLAPAPTSEAAAEDPANADEAAAPTQLAHVAMPAQVSSRSRKALFVCRTAYCFVNNVACQGKVVVAGRICSEALTESKLNDQSIVLEVGVVLSRGAVIAIGSFDPVSSPVIDHLLPPSPGLA